MTLSDVYSCMLTCKFDFCVDATQSKWSNPAETYKLSTRRLKDRTEADYGFNVVDTRIRVKGTGKVVVMRYESTAGKDFELIGRVTPFTFETEG